MYSQVLLFHIRFISFGIIQDTERYRKKKYDATLMHSSDTIGGVYTQDKMQGTQTASKSSFILLRTTACYDILKQ